MAGFWIGILICVLIVIGGSVLAGLALNKRAARRRGPRTRRQEQMDMAKASGAFSHRKSNQP